MWGRSTDRQSNAWLRSTVCAVVVAALATSCAADRDTLVAQRDSPVSTQSVETAGDDSEMPEPCASAIVLDAEAAGALPPTEGARVADVDLPPGTLVAEYSQRENLHLDPVWVSNEPVDNSIWLRLAYAFRSTGLWPLLVDLGEHPGLSGPAVGDQYGSGRAAGPEEFRRYPEKLDLDELPDPLETLSITDGPLELAAAGTQCVEITDAMLPTETRHLVLVPARHAADAIVLAQPLVAANRWSPEELTSVLRSWGSRFGMAPLEVGNATAVLLPQRWPADRAGRLALAAEYAAWAPDQTGEGELGVEDLEPSLFDVADPTWFAWWD